MALRWHQISSRELDARSWHAECFDKSYPMKQLADTVDRQPAIRAGFRHRTYDDTVASWYETAGVASVIGLLLAAAVLVVL
jgi:hypothetical protein